MKIFNLKNINKFIIIGGLLITYSLICAFSYANSISLSLSENVFRLHVIANSDSDEDQNLKYLVRDDVLSYMNTLYDSTNTKEEIIQIVENNLDIFTLIAKNAIEQNGYDYDVTIDIGNFEFPTKHYGDISFPSGYYDSLKIQIGDASGENWWCVMFPPLCFVDISTGIVPDESKELLNNNLESEEYELINNNSNTSIKFKFSVIEFFNKF